MSREVGDFYDIRGDIAFLNGIYTVYVEDILLPLLKKDSMLNLEVDIFSLGYDEEYRADAALSDQVKNYLEIGHFDEEDNFIPLPSNDDFHFPFEEEIRVISRDDPDDDILAQELISFLEDCVDSKVQLEKAVKAFVIRTHWYPMGRFCGVYHAGPDFVRQLKDSVHFQLLPAGALFLKFGYNVMLLTIGYDD